MLDRRPPDFDRFWARTRAELAGVPARPALEPAG
jgi:cephalosporin-C deacetylase-like acetyl esterase